MYNIIYLHLVDFAWNMLVRHTVRPIDPMGCGMVLPQKQHVLLDIGPWLDVGTGVHFWQ